MEGDVRPGDGQPAQMSTPEADQPSKQAPLTILKRDATHLPPKPPEKMHHDGKFQVYMANKVQKLREQYEADLLAGARTNIFAGVKIHVDGFTRPTHQALH